MSDVSGVSDPDHVAVERLLGRYADTVTRRAWDELGDLFLSDATVHIDTVTRPAFTVTGPTALGEFIGSAVARFDFFEFVVLNVVTLPGADDDHVTARVHMCEQRRDAATGEWSTAYGRYLDRVVRTADGWRFEHRDYRSLGRTGADGAVFPHPDRGSTVDTP